MSIDIMAEMQTSSYINKLFCEIKLIVFDFDGVFTDNTVSVTHDGIESVCCWRSDGLGLSRLQDVNVRALILSTERSPVVSVRADKLKIPCIQGVKDKAVAIRDISRDYEIDPGQIAFVGNDINDISALDVVGIPIAVSDAYPEVLTHVVYRTKKPGGRGAVREVCDLVYFVKSGLDIGKASL